MALRGPLCSSAPETCSPTALSPQILLHHMRGRLQLFLKVSSAAFHIPLFHTPSLVPEVTPSKEPSVSHFVLVWQQQTILRNHYRKKKYIKNICIYMHIYIHICKTSSVGPGFLIPNCRPHTQLSLGFNNFLVNM